MPGKAAGPGAQTPPARAAKLEMCNARVPSFAPEGLPVSIVRVGLAETKNFAEGYEAIFGKKKEEKKPEAARTEEAKKEEPKEEKK